MFRTLQTRKTGDHRRSRGTAVTRRSHLALVAGALGVVTACADLESILGSIGDGNGGDTGAVYTMTNAEDGNEILVFPRNADGTIDPPTAVPTGGDGNGAGLGSQGAVVLSDNGRWLLAVNPGSNDLSVLAANHERVSLRDRVASGGEMPVSVAIHGKLVYVLNAAAPNNITGFWLGSDGHLTEIQGSSRPLSQDDTAPAQVSFTDHGRTIVVTEKATNVITTYSVDPQSGLLSDADFVHSEGDTPFGFAFDRRGRLFVSEAFGGQPGASALSSYASGSFTPISSSVGSGETAACWVVITKDGGIAFATNTGSGSVSSYSIANDGSIALLHAVAASTGEDSGPIDMALSGNGRFVFILAPGNGTVRPYSINEDGTLTGLGPISDVPSTAFGLAAS